jgi:hypothetical protein
MPEKGPVLALYKNVETGNWVKSWLKGVYSHFNSDLAIHRARQNCPNGCVLRSVRLYWRVSKKFDTSNLCKGIRRLTPPFLHLIGSFHPACMH